MENWFFIHFSSIFQDFFILYTFVTYQKIFFWGGGLGGTFRRAWGGVEGGSGGCINP